MLHLLATGELLDAKALEEGEVLGLNEAGDILQWGVDIGIYSAREAPEEFGIRNLRAHEVRRINSQPQGSAVDPLLYPLSNLEKDTVLAALLQRLVTPKAIKEGKNKTGSEKVYSMFHTASGAALASVRDQLKEGQPIRVFGVFDGILADGERRANKCFV